MTEYVKKPLLSREGTNLSIHSGAAVTETGAPYGKEVFLYQARPSLDNYQSAHPIIGGWMIDSVAAGIRESSTPRNSNLSSFAPHLFE